MDTDEALRTAVQVLAGLYLAFTAAWRLNRVNGTFSLPLVAGYTLLGASAFLLALHPFIGSLMNWGELTFVLGVCLVTLPYGNVWRDHSLLSALNNGLFTLKSKKVATRKGLMVVSLILAAALYGADKLSGVFAGPPIRIISLRPITDVLKFGEPLQVIVTLQRYYSCPATIYDSFVATDNSGALVRLTPVPAGFTAVGINKVLRVIKTYGVDATGDNYNLASGEYLYTSFSRHRCQVDGHKREFVIQNPQIRIHVERLDSPEIQQ